jgi:hypothetical protein
MILQRTQLHLIIITTKPNWIIPCTTYLLSVSKILNTPCLSPDAKRRKKYASFHQLRPIYQFGNILIFTYPSISSDLSFLHTQILQTYPLRSLQSIRPLTLLEPISACAYPSRHHVSLLHCEVCLLGNKGMKMVKGKAELYPVAVVQARTTSLYFS